jgi:hypothetical protein
VEAYQAPSGTTVITSLYRFDSTAGAAAFERYLTPRRERRTKPQLAGPTRVFTIASAHGRLVVAVGRVGALTMLVQAPATAPDASTAVAAAAVAQVSALPSGAA